MFVGKSIHLLIFDSFKRSFEYGQDIICIFTYLTNCDKCFEGNELGPGEDNRKITLDWVVIEKASLRK